MNVSLKYHASVSRDLDADTAARNRAARAELTCSWCGSEDGMCGGWTREAMEPPALFSEDLSLFHLESDARQLFYPCFQCNPNGIIPDGFTPLTLTLEQVAAWLGQACTCPDCVREREQSGPSPLVAAWQTFQLIEEAIKETSDHSSRDE